MTQLQDILYSYSKTNYLFLFIKWEENYCQSIRKVQCWRVCKVVQSDYVTIVVFLLYPTEMLLNGSKTFFKFPCQSLNGHFFFLYLIFSWIFFASLCNESMEENLNLM